MYMYVYMCVCELCVSDLFVYVNVNCVCVVCLCETCVKLELCVGECMAVRYVSGKFVWDLCVSELCVCE